MAQENDLLLPAESLANALGCSVVKEPATGTLSIRRVGPVATANTYVKKTSTGSPALSTLSLKPADERRIAVGTVILNRVADEAFPYTIQEVILHQGNFLPWPTALSTAPLMRKSVIAAKLCLDGVREADGCLC